VSAVLRAAPDLDAGAIVDVATFDAVPGAVSAVVEIVPSVQLAELDVDPNLLLPDIEMYTVITQVVGPAEIASRVFIPAKGIPEDPVVSIASSRVESSGVGAKLNMETYTR
jgi:predicted PhzF superfamily epimerase YddE/YHI9